MLTAPPEHGRDTVRVVPYGAIRKRPNQRPWPPWLTTQGATLDGSRKSQPAKLTLHRAPENYPLRSRGFHWVQEYPYNS